MSGQIGALLKAGLSLKSGQIRQAVDDYAHDAIGHGRSIVTGYVVGAAFYVAAGVFLIAAIVVGAVALFRWIELHYGSNSAFAIIGSSLVVLSAACALIAAGAMRPPRPHYPSLGSRLQGAVRGQSAKGKSKSLAATPAPAARSTAKQDHVASARRTAADVLRAPSSPNTRSASSSPLVGRAGAALAVGLLGWALARRYSQPAQGPKAPAEAAQKARRTRRT